MFIVDIYDRAICAETDLELNLHLDLVFNEEELNNYFNYHYDYEEDILLINFELNEGGAQLQIEGINSDCWNYKFNDILIQHIKNTKKDYEAYLNV